MAVVDVKIDTLLEAGTIGNPQKNNRIVYAQPYTQAATDSNGSVYRVGTVVDSDVPLVGSLLHTNITGGTNYTFGVYDTAVNGGAVVNAALFLGTTSLANTTEFDLFALANTAANRGKAIWELLGLAAPTGKRYDLALTANIVGTSGGTLNAKVELLRQ